MPRLTPRVAGVRGQELALTGPAGGDELDEGAVLQYGGS